MQKFIKGAIKSNYTGNHCAGWDWIRENLSDLDYIFQTDEYKKCKGYVGSCMSLILSGDENELEKGILNTAWYLNNERISNAKELKKTNKFNEDGFFNIEDDEKLDGRKVEFIVDTSSEMFGSIKQSQGKLVWSSTDKRIMVMKPRCRRRGHWLSKRVYVKLLK